MVKQRDDNKWANFEGAERSTFTAQADYKSSTRGRPKSDASSSTSRWMSVPIDSEDLLPLAPPEHIVSPRRGSAASRTRFTTDISVKSARRPETVSTFSRKNSSDTAKILEQSTGNRTVSTSTADSNSDSERGREKVVLGSPRTLRVPKHFFADAAPLLQSSNVKLSKSLKSTEFSQKVIPSSHDTFRISNQRNISESRNATDTIRGRSNIRENTNQSRAATNEKVTIKSRGRSTCRSTLPPPIDVVKMSSRSSSQPRHALITEAPITPRRRSTSRSRYPPTTPSSHNTRLRSRSTSLTRFSNEVRSSSPAKRPHRRPPSTYRTRQELRDATLVVNGGRATASEGDANSARSSNGWNSVPEPESTGEFTDSSMPLIETANNSKVGLRERLFGNEVDGSWSNRLSSVGLNGNEIRPRVLLAATVYHNKATNFWIATINTNQRGVAKNPERANKYLKAFSFATESEARESAIVNAPPKMIPFDESPVCFCCKGKFAVFRRAGHCRNCGVCVCSSCSVSWPAKLIPETYNLKTEANVKVCRSCNTLSLSFKRSLLQGDYDETIALYRTGNVNLRTPFPASSKRDELMYPIHCAAEGGNIHILRWLIDEHFCPIKVHTTSKKNANATTMADSPIRTSKGRTVLSIAIESLKVDMMRYLVVELGIPIYECKDLRPVLSALEASLSALPGTMGHRNEVPQTVPAGVTRWDNATFDDDCSEPSSLGADDEAKYVDETKSRTSGSRNGGLDQGGQQACVICFDRKISCVGTPCGHAVSCIDCSRSLKICPICNERCTFIKICRP